MYKKNIYIYIKIFNSIIIKFILRNPSHVCPPKVKTWIVGGRPSLSQKLTQCVICREFVAPLFFFFLNSFPSCQNCIFLSPVAAMNSKDPNKSKLITII